MGVKKKKRPSKRRMKKLSREGLFTQASEKLHSDFELLHPTPSKSLKGKKAEEILKRFLNGHLPMRFRAGSGYIIDSDNNTSKQTDIIIYDALNCPIYRASDDSSIFPNDTVAIAIEVKSILDKPKIDDCSSKIGRIKILKKRLYASTTIQQWHSMNWQTRGFVFAYESSISLNKIAEHYTNLISKLGSQRYQKNIDAIFILNKGIVCLSTKHRADRWIADPTMNSFLELYEGTHIGVVAISLGKKTLDAFFRIILDYLQTFGSFTYLSDFPWILTKPSMGKPLYYLESITDEKDPEKRRNILEKYKREACNSGEGSKD
jgi:hypothetical protein